MSGHVQNCHFYYIQPGCECGLQTRDHWAPSWNLGWISKIILSVLDQVRTKFGPWNPEYGTIRDNTGCPKIVGRKDVTFPKSRFGPYSGFQGPNLVRTWSRTLRTHPRVATTQNTGQYGTSENRWAERYNFSDTIFGFLTKSQKPPKVEDCKMELGLVPGWDWASPKIRWAKRCNFSDQIFV